VLISQCMNCGNLLVRCKQNKRLNVSLFRRALTDHCTPFITNVCATDPTFPLNRSNNPLFVFYFLFFCGGVWWLVALNIDLLANLLI
jgi:hypothetical protein